MSRGRFTFVLVVALACAMLLSACGDDKQTTGSATGETAATGATGASAESQSGKKKSSKSKDSSDSSQPQSSSGSGSDSSDSSSSGGSKKKPNHNASSGTESTVNSAVLRMEKAIQVADSDYLCKQAYAKEHVEKMGGMESCIKRIKIAMGRFKNHRMSVTDISFLSPSEAQVNARLSFVLNKEKKQSEPVLNFKLEGGEWRYYIRATENLK